MRSLANVFDNGRYRGFRWFDLEGESPCGRVSRMDVLHVACEIDAMNESDYVSLFFGSKDNLSYVEHVADLLPIVGVTEFFAEFGKCHLSDSQKRAWLAGFVSGVASFYGMLGYPKPEHTPRNRFSSVLK